VSPKIKYLLFQIPGWIITAIVLMILLHWEFIPKWLAVLCFVASLLKDLLLYPFLRRAYEPGVTGSARLVGSRGVAEGDLAPTGYIRVRGELWRAVVSPADNVIRSGTEVEVVSADRMEVFVRAVGARTGE
jgi:membrane protein implicated in regulation of membrane protease activity